MNLPRALWIDAGSPDVDGQHGQPGNCALCAQPDTHTVPASTLPSGYSDYAAMRLPSSDRICRSCTWIMRGKPPHTWRLWSVVYRLDRPAEESAGPAHGPHTLCTNRGNVRPVLDCLLRPPQQPWGVSIAVSGQKHVLTTAEACTGLWRPFYEGQAVHGNADDFADLRSRLVSLRSVGFTAEEITSGRISSQRITVDAIAVWRAVYPTIQTHRDSTLTALALWTITKETMTDDV